MHSIWAGAAARLTPRAGTSHNDPKETLPLCGSTNLLSVILLETT